MGLIAPMAPQALPLVPAAAAIRCSWPRILQKSRRPCRHARCFALCMVPDLTLPCAFTAKPGGAGRGLCKEPPDSARYAHGCGRLLAMLCFADTRIYVCSYNSWQSRSRRHCLRTCSSLCLGLSMMPGFLTPPCASCSNDNLRQLA
jgi:hypothetical protein